MTKKIALIVIISFFLNACNALKPEKVDARKVPTSAEERAKKNIKQGGGFNPGSLLGRGNTNFEFSSSNPMWRASLEILDFIPMSTVDYSGGMIISDWYTGDSNNANESIKISIRFLSNEIRSDSLKIIVHKKNCSGEKNCRVSLLDNSKITQELRASILRKASVLEKESKDKKKR
tara:strand:- start:9462 stop:9989 length:528 start_codon:yes stop_codon:yes gene_type:complete